MLATATVPAVAAWKGYDKVAFRFAFLYFVLAAVPLDPKYYRQALSIDWFHLQYGDLFYLARYTPQWTGWAPKTGWGMATAADWAVCLFLAWVGTVAWTRLDRERRDYRTLYYGLRVVLRYRLAIGVLAYGFILPSSL